MIRVSQISGALRFGLPRQWGKRKYGHRFNSRSFGHGLSNLIPGWTQIPVRPSHQRCGDWKRNVELFRIHSFWWEVAKAVQAIASETESLNQLSYSIKALVFGLSWIDSSHIPTGPSPSGDNGNNQQRLLGDASRPFSQNLSKWRSVGLLPTRCNKDPNSCPIKLGLADGSIPFGIGPQQSLMVIHFFNLDANDTTLSSAFLRREDGIYWIQIWKRKKQWLGISF